MIVGATIAMLASPGLVLSRLAAAGNFRADHIQLGHQRTLLSLHPPYGMKEVITEFTKY